MNEYSITSVMTADVLSVTPGTGLKEIATLMSQNRFSCVLVTEDSVPVGIITERDIVNQFSSALDNLSHQADTLLASDIMTKNPITLDQEQQLMDALVISMANKIRHIPVVDQNNHLCGLVTYSDIAKIHIRLIESQAAIIERNIRQRTSELEEANRMLHELSLVDPMLGIGNRRAMEIDMKSTHDLSCRYKTSYSIAMIDVDFFKKYNDHYGHQAGDETLVQVAKSIEKVLRSSDRVYRYGGEEFLVLLPQTAVEGAVKYCERLLAVLEDINIPHCDSDFARVTVSCGISQFVYSENGEQLDWASIIEQADKALYQSKTEGRNRLSVYKL